MSSDDDARMLLEAFTDFADDAAGNGYTPSEDRPVRIGTVDPAYSGTGAAKVTFDGETTMTVKSYVVMEPVRPSDRVVLLPVGRGYVILGKVGGTPLRAGRNLIINNRGRVNQRGAVSGTSLASGAYFIDRWRSTAATNAVTWTGDDTVGRTLTVPASKGIATTLERTNVPADTYVLSDPGSTAQGRVYNSGGSVPAMADLPLVVTLDGSANVIVERGPGTVIATQLERGVTPTPPERVDVGLELAMCMRYYEKSYEPTVAPGTNTVVGMREHYGAADGSGNMVAFIPYKVQKRAAGTVTAYRQDGTVNSWAYQRSGANGNGATTNNYRQGVNATCIYLGIGAAWAGGFVTGHWVVDAEL